MCESREELVWKPNAIADVDLLMYLRAARYDAACRYYLTIYLYYRHCFQYYVGFILVFSFYFGSIQFRSILTFTNHQVGLLIMIDMYTTHAYVIFI